MVINHLCLHAIVIHNGHISCIVWRKNRKFKSCGPQTEHSRDKQAGISRLCLLHHASDATLLMKTTSMGKPTWLVLTGAMASALNDWMVHSGYSQGYRMIDHF